MSKGVVVVVGSQYPAAFSTELLEKCNGGFVKDSSTGGTERCGEWSSAATRELLFLLTLQQRVQ